MRALRLLAVLGLLGSPAPAAVAPPTPVPVTVTLVDDAFRPDHLVFKHGIAYRLHLQNTGKEFHEFTAPQFLKAIRIATAGVVNREGTQIDLPPAATKDLDFVAPRPGRYRLWCADHDWAGMTGDIRVE